MSSITGITLRKHLCIGLLLALGAADGFAQLERVSPKKADSMPGKPAAEAGPAKSYGSPDDAGPALRGILIVKSREEIQAGDNVSVNGLKIGDGMQLDILRGVDFRAHLDRYLGKPINQYNIHKIQEEIILYYRSKDHPLVDVVFPAQSSVNSGVLQIFVMEGKLGKVTVEGNKWFSSSLFSSAVRLRPGESVDTSTLIEDVTWLNQNPGHQVDVAFKPGSKLGESDVVLRVQDRFPLRVYTGYENSGPFLSGEDRVFAGFNWFNAFGQDQVLNYQFTTDTEWKFVKAHSASYEIPLPWRHNLTFFGGYVESRADLATAPAGLPVASQTGTSYQLSTRYAVPLPKIASYQHTFDVGFDFKRMDNTLEFGGVPIFGGAADVDQFVFEYSGQLPDKLGGTTAGAEVYYSPGGLSSNDKNANYNQFHQGASSSYIYSKFHVQRECKLPEDFSIVLRAMAQVANGPLIPSEQLGLGGAGTVRGYDEREANGDQGYYLSAELWSPGFSIANLFDKRANDKLQLLAFFDYGQTQNKLLLPAEDPHILLESVGVGMRYTFSRYLSVKFDYGWQLVNSHVSPQDQEHSRGHISAVLSF